MVDNEVNKRVVIEITTDDKASAQLEKISKLIDSIKGGTVNIGVSGAGSAGTPTQPNRQQEITKTAVDRALKTLSQSKEKSATDRMSAQTQKLIDKAEKDRIGEVKKHIPLYKQFRSSLTGVLIDLHLIRIAGQHSKVVATMFQTLADSVGALIDIALLPMMDLFGEFIQNFLGVVSWLGSLKGFFRGIIAALAAFLIAMITTTGLINAAMGVFRWAGIFGKPKQRASGGPLGAGQAAIVGERGPELIVPSRAVDVVPNNKLRFLAEGTVGSSISSMFLGGVGGAAIGGLLTGGWGGAIGGGLLGGGLGAFFDMPNLLAEGVTGIMSNTGVQSVLTSLNVVAGSINAILAPLAPVMGVAGLALGAAFGAKRALGGGSEKMTAAQIKQDASIGYGTQNMIQSAAKGTNNLLTLILLRLSQCFRICPDSIQNMASAFRGIGGDTTIINQATGTKSPAAQIAQPVAATGAKKISIRTMAPTIQGAEVTPIIPTKSIIKPAAVASSGFDIMSILGQLGGGIAGGIASLGIFGAGKKLFDWFKEGLAPGKEQIKQVRTPSADYIRKQALSEAPGYGTSSTGTRIINPSKMGRFANEPLTTMPKIGKFGGYGFSVALNLPEIIEAVKSYGAVAQGQKPPESAPLIANLLDEFLNKRSQQPTTIQNTFNIQGTDQTIIDKIVKELQLQSNRTRGMGI